MSYSQQLEYFKKRQFGEKVNATFVFIRENAWPFLKVQLMIAGPILLLISILLGNMMGDLNFDLESGFTANNIIDLLEVYGLTILSTMVTTTVIPTVTYGYMVAYQDNPPKDITVAAVTRNFAGRFFNILGFNFLTYIVVIIASFFLILPGIYVGIALTLGASIIVFESSNPIDAFSRSFKLVSGKWWSTFGLLIVMGIIGYIINLFFGLPRAIVMGIDAFTAFQEDGDVNGLELISDTSRTLNILFSLLETFGAILLYALVYIAMAFQYFNLVERKESRGLVAKIEQMDNEAAEEDSDEDY
ncbi:hypothetical protein [Roseivirga misakiensis]|uniref:DUF7847 domain-containing protein n=1 Tax=Roseivirga misakiensis TaxID=1563681 RepID=A0A1E5T3K2_9BACT|nr:hypothetical protein [Roseivirga misakiensis]OEK05952.1 hypothetical protein BFP71_07520 [Roseivirga misakiensis]